MVRWSGRVALVAAMLLTTFIWLVLPAQAATTVPACPANQTDFEAAIVAAGAGGTVLFTCDAHITLSSTIALDNVTIDGNGHDVTIDGNHAVRIFTAYNTVTLIGLHLVNGASLKDVGGAIATGDAGTLTIRDSTLSGNQSPWGGAIHASDSSVTIIGSTLSDNIGEMPTVDGNRFGFGGVIYGGGTLIIDRSTIRNNESVYGGVVSGAFSSMTITDSTLSGNAAYSGGAIAIAMDDVALLVANSTLIDNRADNGGGAIQVTGTRALLVFANSTLAGNTAAYGGSIMSNAGTTLEATNSIFAGADQSNACARFGVQTAIDHGGNLATDWSCGLGTERSLADLDLGALADNGGPTQTVALGADSAARGAGVSDACNAAPINGLDQRGSARPGTTCDSGAYDTGTRPDTTAPTVTVTGIVDGAVYTVGDTIPPVGCATTDAESGVATEATLSSSGGPVGPITVTCSGAMDNAGNVANPVAISYSVVYAWGGFSGVVKNPPATTTWIAGLPVPVTFAIAGQQGRAAVTGLTSRSCSAAPGVGEVSAGSLFNIGVVSLGWHDQYLFAWTTPRAWKTTCRVLTVTLADGTTHEATFSFR